MEKLRMNMDTTKAALKEAIKKIDDEVATLAKRRAILNEALEALGDGAPAKVSAGGPSKRVPMTTAESNRKKLRERRVKAANALKGSGSGPRKQAPASSTNMESVLRALPASIDAAIPEPEVRKAAGLGNLGAAKCLKALVNRGEVRTVGTRRGAKYFKVFDDAPEQHEPESNQEDDEDGVSMGDVETIG